MKHFFFEMLGRGENKMIADGYEVRGVFLGRVRGWGDWGFKTSRLRFLAIRYGMTRLFSELKKRIHVVITDVYCGNKIDIFWD